MSEFQKKAKGSILSYAMYLKLVEQLVNFGLTTGENQTEALAGFTALNLKRMQRIDKTLKLSSQIVAAISELEQAQEWLLITEAWCGDSAQALPVISAMAAESKGKINLSIILRDENPELMAMHLTNGNKSIPKLVAFGKNQKELFTWGPRPYEAQQLLVNWKTNPNDRTWDDFEKELHTWYAKDKTQSIQQEFQGLILNQKAVY